MLTKLLRADQAEGAQPISWRRAGGPIAGTQSPSGTAGNIAQSLSKAASPEEQVAILRVRLAELEKSAEQQMQAARASAYREGEEAGGNQAAARLQPVLDRMARSIHELGELKPRLRRDAEADLLILALAIARKILHRELSIDPDAIAGLIKVSIEKIRMQEILRVRVHPQNQQIVQQLLARMPGSTRIEILPDAKLDVGGVLVETSRGDFDASVDLQLKEIERGLTDRLAGHK